MIMFSQKLLLAVSSKLILPINLIIVEVEVFLKVSKAVQTNFSNFLEKNYLELIGRVERSLNLGL